MGIAKYRTCESGVHRQAFRTALFMDQCDTVNSLAVQADGKISTITWHRGGTSPEVSRTTFDSSTDAIDWRSLGAGERIPGGWRLARVGLQTNSTIRARGFVSSGGNSSGFVETIGGPFTFTNRPVVSISRNGGLPLLSIAGDIGSPYALEFVPRSCGEQFLAASSLPVADEQSAELFGLIGQRRHAAFLSSSAQPMTS